MRQLKISQQITSRESKSFTKYLIEIANFQNFPLISTEEEVELAEKSRQGDREARDSLVKANLRFVISVAKQYQNQGLTLEDLINEGNIGLIKAAERFDERKGFKFISYAVWWIRQTILQSLTENAKKIRIPLNKLGDINKLKKTAALLEQMNQREPTLEEVCDALNEKYIDKNYTIEYVKDLSKIELGVLSLDATLTEGEDGGSLLDVLYDKNGQKTDELLKKEDVIKGVNKILSRLTEREKIVLKHYFGLNDYEQMTLNGISNVLDLTRERVRQIKENALKKLKARLNYKNINL